MLTRRWWNRPNLPEWPPILVHILDTVCRVHHELEQKKICLSCSSSAGTKKKLFVMFIISWNKKKVVCRVHHELEQEKVLTTLSTSDFLIEYSNYLNTKHLKSKHMTFRTLFCPVFKWSDHMISRTIKKLDILTINRKFCPVFWPPFENQTIW